MKTARGGQLDDLNVKHASSSKTVLPDLSLEACKMPVCLYFLFANGISTQPPVKFLRMPGKDAQKNRKERLRRRRARTEAGVPDAHDGEKAQGQTSFSDGQGEFRRNW